MILKRISEDQVAELVDSIIVSVGAEDPSTVTAGVIWMEDGDVGDESGPMTVPERWHSPQRLPIVSTRISFTSRSSPIPLSGWKSGAS